jgi:hypothetical protein
MAVIGPGCVLPPRRPFTTSLTVPYQTTGTFARSREAVRGGPRRPVDSPARFERRPPVAGRRQGLLRGWLRWRARRGGPRKCLIRSVNRQGWRWAASRGQLERRGGKRIGIENRYSRSQSGG